MSISGPRMIASSHEKQEMILSEGLGVLGVKRAGNRKPG